MEEFVVKLRTVVPVLTAGVERESEMARESGIVGSLRWWYEALVRGLGGFACDPTSDDRCQLDEVAYQSDGLRAGLQDVCPACRLFGCGGWASKFHLLLTDARGKPSFSLNDKNIPFRILFMNRTSWENEERWLMSRVFALIDRYGSIGGKTTLKPPSQPDYGQVAVEKNVPAPDLDGSQIRAWLQAILQVSPNMQHRLATQPVEIPRLDLFFFNTSVWLDRRQMNELVHIDRSGFMAGERGVSKKVFSFQTTHRFWGYTIDQKMLDNVLDALNRMGIRGTQTGKEVLNVL
jgi:CRISPR-associated protein Cmr1